MHQPGIEPGSVPWQGTILPLDHWCLLFIGLFVIVLSINAYFFFLSFQDFKPDIKIENNRIEIGAFWITS